MKSSKQAHDQKLVINLLRAKQKLKINFQNKLQNQVRMEKRNINFKVKLKLWKNKFLFKINKTNYY